MSELLPLFLNLAGRPVLLVGGGPVATAKLRQLLVVGAHVHVVAPEISLEIEALTGRKVIGFMSDNHIDPDLAVEVFVLAPLAERASSARSPAK